MTDLNHDQIREQIAGIEQTEKRIKYQAIIDRLDDGDFSNINEVVDTMQSLLDEVEQLKKLHGAASVVVAQQDELLNMYSDRNILLEEVAEAARKQYKPWQGLQEALAKLEQKP